MKWWLRNSADMAAKKFNTFVYIIIRAVSLPALDPAMELLFMKKIMNSLKLLGCPRRKMNSLREGEHMMTIAEMIVDFLSHTDSVTQTHIHFPVCLDNLVGLLQTWKEGSKAG